jgi:hypothetical protein
MEQFIAEGLVKGLCNKKVKKAKRVPDIGPIVPLLDIGPIVPLLDIGPIVPLLDSLVNLCDNDDGDDSDKGDDREREFHASVSSGIKQRVVGDKYRRVSIKGGDDHGDGERDSEISTTASSSSSSSSAADSKGVNRLVVPKRPVVTIALLAPRVMTGGFGTTIAAVDAPPSVLVHIDPSAPRVDSRGAPRVGAACNLFQKGECTGGSSCRLSHDILPAFLAPPEGMREPKNLVKVNLSAYRSP